MSETTDLGDLIADSLGPLLDRLCADAERLVPERRQEFAVNVLLNALLSVLETVREEGPERYESYLRMLLLMLRDD